MDLILLLAVLLYAVSALAVPLRMSRRTITILNLILAVLLGCAVLAAFGVIDVPRFIRLQ